MVLKFKSVQYVIIFTIYLLDEFHQTSPQNETEYKTISSSKSTEEPGKSTAVSAKQNSSGHNNESIFLTLLPQNNLSVQSTHTVLQVNSTPIPTLDPQTNSIVQSTTLPLQHNLTVQPTATTKAVQNPSEEQTKSTANATTQVTSTPIPTSDPQTNSIVQSTTLPLQHNLTVQPTATTKAVQNPSEEQTKSTANATTQVTSTPIPTLDPQTNSIVQSTTLPLQHNLTVQPTATTKAVQNPSEEQTKSTANTTLTQVTSTPIPPWVPQPITYSPSNTAGVRFAFRRKQYNFDLNLLNKDSEVYINFETELFNEFTRELGQYDVTDVTLLFIRPGSVEVTTVLTVNDRNNITNVERALHNLNQTGRLGSINLIGIFWKAEDETCQPPDVSILNLPRWKENEMVHILRSKDFIVQTLVNKTNCNPPQKLLFEWRLSKYSVDQSNDTIIETTTTLNSKTTEWNLQKRQLDYGLYFVDFKAALESNPPVVNSTLGFFNITKSPIIADILGGNKVTRGKGSVITLDASASRDPDVEPGNYTSMQFTWLCKRREETFPTGPLDSVPVITASSGPGGGGCFGTGVGKLASNLTVVTLETSLMTVDRSYDVKLVVTKDDRKDEFVQEIKIVSGNPPIVIIRCLINCDKIASESTRISLTTECSGDPCERAKYHWQLNVVHFSGVEDNDKELTDKAETYLNSTGIIIKKNQLRELPLGHFYRLKVEVSQQGEPPGYATYQFRINAPPQHGSCSVTPTKGEALKTQFKFECRNWQDRDEPITYQFYYKTENGVYTVISYGSESLVKTVLPPGKIRIKVMVSDRLSATNTAPFEIEVKPAPASENLSQLTVGNSSLFNRLVQLGDVRGATQLANAVLESAEQRKSTTIHEKIAIKDSVVKTVSEIQVGNLQSLIQVTSIIARATLEPSEVTFDTQKLALKTLTSMTSLLSSKTTEDYASEYVLVEEGGENLVLGLGNLLHSTAQKADVVGQTKEPMDVRSKSENISRDTEKLIDDVATALLSKMIVDQEPRRINTKSINMELSRMSSRSRGTSADFTDDDRAGFKFSLAAITDDKVTTPEYIDSVLTMSAFNPFTWDNSSAVVRDSHVLSLNLKDDEGEPLIVKDSREDIEIKIPRKVRFTPEERVSFFVKPSSEGKMQYHEINSPGVRGNALRLRITPERPTIFKVFVRQGQRPTVTEYDLTKRIPDESCSISPQASQRGCSEEAYDVVLYHELISEAGKYYIGILYEGGSVRPQGRKKRSCFGSGRQKRSCVEIKDPPRPENKTIKPVYNSRTDMNYSMNVLEESCVFWDSREEHWLSTGCRVGPKSDLGSLHCLCNHLTSFGGGVLVMPNTLDFDVVFTELGRLDQTGNVAVLCTIIIVLLLYLLVVIFARKADKRDQAKRGPALHLTLTQEASYEYDLTVVTGVWRESGTDANVAIVIHGSEAESQPIVLQKDMINSRKILARGNEDRFVIHLPMSLGIMQYIRVWHDNSGKSPSWYFSHAVVKDCQTGKKWTFINNSWLALEKGDGKIDRILTPLSSREMKTFKRSLNSRGSKSFSEGHLWLSVITKPPGNKFTRVQRATCCLCLLLSAMLTNALFYRTEKTGDPTMQIGPLKFSWRQIVVGIESALIVTPVNLLIASLFKNSAKKPLNKVDVTKLEDAPEPVQRNSYSSLGCEEDTSGVKAASKSNTSSFWTRTRGRMWGKTKKDFICPHFCIYIAWFLSLATVSVSACFTFFFSLMWGKDIANQWLSSMLVSFTEDLFVLQPIKIVLLMVLAACFLSNRNDADFHHVKNHETTAQLSSLETEVACDTQGRTAEIPEEAVLEQAREYRVKEAKMYSFGRELVVYLLFLLLLTIVCYGNRSYHGYLMTKNLKDTFSNYSLAKDPRIFWTWLNRQFVNGIYAGKWYNDEKVKEQEYIGDKMSILLGVPRLRQLRVQKDSCLIPEQLQEVVKHCNDFYSVDEEDRTHFHLPGWMPFTGSVSWANFSDLCPAPWRYVKKEKIQNSPSWGFFHVYDGGGYIADLGYSKLTADRIITNLRQYDWVDRQTRAVLLEFSIYNPNTGYISILTYHYEVLPTGYGNPFAKIDTLLVTSTETGFHRFYLICQLLFILMVIFFVLKEVYNIFKQKCSYFRNAWNWVQILQIIFSFLVVVFYVLKSQMVLESVIKVKKNPFASVSFGEAVDWNHAENSVLALTVFTTTVKLLRMIRFNPHVSIMMSSLRLSRGLLMSYSVIFAIIIFSYAQFGRLAFGEYMLRYSSFQRTVFSEFVMCLGGKMDLEELRRANRVLGPLFGFSFLTLMSFIFVNFFVAILNDSYEDIRENTDKQSKDFEMHDFILERLRELLGFNKETERENDNDNNTDLLEHPVPQENVPHGKLTFTSVVVYSQRLRHMARRKQLRISKLKEENDTERANVVRFECERPATMADVETRKRTIQKLKCVTSSLFIMKSLAQERMLERMSDLIEKLAMDDVQRDEELLFIIRLLLLMNMNYDDCSSIRGPDDTSSLDDIAISSLTTPLSSPISGIDKTRGEPVDTSDDETLDLLRRRELSRPLPYHLRGMELREQLRSTLATKRSKRFRLRPSNSLIYKYYSFL